MRIAETTSRMAWLEFADIASLWSRAVWPAPDTVRCKLLVDSLASWSCAAGHPVCCPRPAVTTIKGFPLKSVSVWACVKAAGSSDHSARWLLNSRAVAARASSRGERFCVLRVAHAGILRLSGLPRRGSACAARLRLGSV